MTTRRRPGSRSTATSSRATAELPRSVAPVSPPGSRSAPPVLRAPRPGGESTLAATPRANAARADGELEMRQSASLRSSNQIKDRTHGRRWIDANIPSIHRALLPPTSSLATSDSSTGVDGARVCTASSGGPKAVSNDRQRCLNSRLPPLKPETATTSTSSSPGKLRGSMAPATGDQTHCTLVAPAAWNTPRTWRHARTYSPGLLPLTPSHHGYQVPFISWANRTRTVRPYVEIARAQAPSARSWSPAVIARSAYFGCRAPWACREASHGSNDTAGTAPRAAIASACAAVNATDCRSPNHITMPACRPLARSKASTSASCEACHGRYAARASARVVTPTSRCGARLGAGTPSAARSPARSRRSTCTAPSPATAISSSGVTTRSALTAATPRAEPPQARRTARSRRTRSWWRSARHRAPWPPPATRPRAAACGSPGRRRSPPPRGSPARS